MAEIHVIFPEQTVTDYLRTVAESERGQVFVDVLGRITFKDRASLVNASSDLGKKLTSGRTSSTVTRVISDVEMASLLRELDKAGFSSVARDGVSMAALRDDSARRGVIVVEQDGRFAREFSDEQRSGYATFERLRAEAFQHPINHADRAVRSLLARAAH